MGLREIKCQPESVWYKCYEQVGVGTWIVHHRAQICLYVCGPSL